MIQEKLMPDSCSWHEKTPIYDISSKIPAGFRLCEKETPVRPHLSKLGQKWGQAKFGLKSTYFDF